MLVLTFLNAKYEAKFEFIFKSFFVHPFKIVLVLFVNNLFLNIFRLIKHLLWF